MSFQQEIAHFSKHKHFIIITGKNIVPSPHDSWDIEDRWMDGVSKKNAECLFLVLNKEISLTF